MKRLVSLAAVALLIAGCSARNSPVHLMLTDAPTDLTDVASVNVTFDDVRAHVVIKGDGKAKEPAVEETTAPEAEEGKSGWKIVCNEKKTFDLLTLTGGKLAELCPQIDLEEGKITQIRLVLSAAEIVKTDGTLVPLVVPSGAKSGLKIVGLSRFTKPGSTAEITLDFDAAASITKSGAGYSFNPTIKPIDPAAGK